LLVVPDSALVRGRLRPEVKKGVPIKAEFVPWQAAVFANLCVSLHADGSVGVRRFRRCVHCERGLPINAEWYKGLPEIGARARRG
jgi:hypothetical protein